MILAISMRTNAQVLASEDSNDHIEGVGLDPKIHIIEDFGLEVFMLPNFKSPKNSEPKSLLPKCPPKIHDMTRLATFTLHEKWALFHPSQEKSELNHIWLLRGKMKNVTFLVQISVKFPPLERESLIYGNPRSKTWKLEISPRPPSEDRTIPRPPSLLFHLN